MKTWHKTNQSDIILFKDWGGVGREGGITKWEGKFSHVGGKKGCE